MSPDARGEPGSALDRFSRMNDDQDYSDDDLAGFEQAIAEERRRELAVEHLLFQTLSYVEAKHPGLLDHLEGSLGDLGDSADDETKDDDAVREIARLFIHSLRSGR